jgi:predicted esterase
MLGSLCLCFSLIPATGRTEAWIATGGGVEAPMTAWIPDRGIQAVLVLVPGYGGKGESMLDERWKAFADKRSLVLLVPTFHEDASKLQRNQGYYYPEQGSGELMERALEELHRRTGADTSKVLFFGFSAGAHFSHRFALWRPKRVKAFVAYSAGWWSEPEASLKQVPALIMCGEADERYAATFDFFRKGQQLGCPWIWRSYRDTGHEVTSIVRNMSEAFFEVCLTEKPREPHYGDIQIFKSVGRDERETIPEEFRILLPSTEVAEIWEKEK